MTRPPDEHEALAHAAIHEDWVAKYRTADSAAFYETAFDEVVRRLGAPAGATILDAGCGNCAKSLLLARRGFHVVATDFSADALRMSGPTLEAQGVRDRVTLKQGDLLDLPFADGEFRYAICWGVLMHVPQLERAISELARVIAPGGQLVLSEGNMYSAQSIAMRALKKVLGRGRARVERVPAGLECHEDIPSGHLLTRQTDMTWLIGHMASLRLDLKARLPGQFSELYAIVPGRPLKRAIHIVNDLWFRRIRRPGPAFGNILIFEKR